jgi:hypothetical protein
MYFSMMESDQLYTWSDEYPEPDDPPVMAEWDRVSTTHPYRRYACFGP